MGKGRLNYSEDSYQELLARMKSHGLAKIEIPDDPHETDEEPESTLSKKIRKHCTDNGWPALILPQNKLLAWFIPEGWPDGVIALPQRRTVWLELKSKKGQLREKQRLMGSMLRFLGHEFYQVKTWKFYLEIVYNEQTKSI